MGGQTVPGGRGIRSVIDKARPFRRSVLITAVVLVLLLGAITLTEYGSGQSNGPVPRAAAPLRPGPPQPGPPPQPVVPAPPQAQGAQKQLTIWLTGYSWQDNTPPGSSAVGEPVLHTQAGGTGTYADPITVAVPGHKGDMDWQPGTRFYLPSVQRYVMVEDSGAAKPPSGADTHLDMWIGGQDGTKDTTDDCESQLTGDVPAVLNPPDNEQVMTGSIFVGGKCNIPPQNYTDGTYTSSSSHHHHSDNDGDN
jgi:hypothetical protein